jgi:dihydropteroate synthase
LEYQEIDDIQRAKFNRKEALNGTTVLNTVALTKGANICRCTMKEAVECVQLWNKMTV